MDTTVTLGFFFAWLAPPLSPSFEKMAVPANSSEKPVALARQEARWAPALFGGEASENPLLK
jgi:hypothetical protein